MVHEYYKASGSENAIVAKLKHELDQRKAFMVSTTMTFAINLATGSSTVIATLSLGSGCTNAWAWAHMVFHKGHQLASIWTCKDTPKISEFAANCYNMLFMVKKQTMQQCLGHMDFQAAIKQMVLTSQPSCAKLPAMGHLLAASKSRFIYEVLLLLESVVWQFWPVDSALQSQLVHKVVCWQHFEVHLSVPWHGASMPWTGFHQLLVLWNWFSGPGWVTGNGQMPLLLGPWRRAWVVTHLASPPDVPTLLWTTHMGLAWSGPTVIWTWAQDLAWLALKRPS